VSTPNLRTRIEEVTALLARDMASLQSAVEGLLTATKPAHRVGLAVDVLKTAKSIVDNSLELIGAASAVLYQSQEAK
jgi:hypothetical protein